MLKLKAADLGAVFLNWMADFNHNSRILRLRGHALYN